MPASSLRTRSLLSRVTPSRSARAPESVDFPLPRKPADERQADSGRTKVPQGRRDQPACGPLRAGRALVRLDERDLGTHERAIGDVVVTEGGRRRVAAVLAVRGEEECRRLRGTELFQVHGEEGGIVEAVDVAQPVVEIQTVEHAWAVVEAEDVVGEQVAVPVHHPPLFDAHVEQPFSAMR